MELPNRYEQKAARIRTEAAGESPYPPHFVTLTLMWCKLSKRDAESTLAQNKNQKNMYGNREIRKRFTNKK